jgi:hypothetical protein
MPPTERSMPPPMMTNATPSARIPVYAESFRMRDIFLQVKKAVAVREYISIRATTSPTVMSVRVRFASFFEPP